MACLSLILLSLLVIIGDYGSQSETYHGLCENASVGQKYSKSEFECHADASCTETDSSEVCCSSTNKWHNSFSKLSRTYNKNGIRIARKKRSNKCSRCTEGSTSYAKSEGWES